MEDLKALRGCFTGVSSSISSPSSSSFLPPSADPVTLATVLESTGVCSPEVRGVASWRSHRVLQHTAVLSSSLTVLRGVGVSMTDERGVSSTGVVTSTGGGGVGSRDTGSHDVESLASTLSSIILYTDQWDDARTGSLTLAGSWRLCSRPSFLPIRFCVRGRGQMSGRGL